MKRFIEYMFGLIICVTVILACSKSETDEEVDSGHQPEGYLTMAELGDNPVDLTAEQGTYILKIFSDKEWKAEISFQTDDGPLDKSEEWCILSSKTGIDASEIYIGFSRNKWNIPRSATIDFSLEDSGETYSLELNQDAAETFYSFVCEDIKNDELTFKKSGQEYRVHLETNAYDWAVCVVDEGGDEISWCTVDHTKGSGDAELTLQASYNSTDLRHVAYLRFSSLGETFDDQLCLVQNAQFMAFEDMKHEIMDDGTHFQFKWSDQTDGASFRLVLAKDKDYTDIIEEIEPVTAIDNSYSVDLSTIQYGGYVGTVYAKLECNDPVHDLSATIEDRYHSHFDQGSGDGSMTSPYVISNIRHLKNIEAVTETEKFFEQTEDIDLTGAGFLPLCAEGFGNTFDGGNHVLSGLGVNDSDMDDFGLFKKINESGTVKNVVLTDVDITARTRIGSLAALNLGKIYNCTAEGNITSALNSTDASYYIGGLVGSMEAGSIESSVNRVNINAKSKIVGGICGSVNGTCTVRRCGNEGNIASNKPNVGGIIGESKKSMTVEECYNRGAINANTSAGGIVGYTQLAGFSIKNCYNTGAVHATNKTGHACGILGFSNKTDTTIENCYNVGTMSNGGDPNYASGITNAANLVNKLMNCFYLSTSASQAAPDSSVSGNEPKDESRLKNQSTYNGWDFVSVWTMPANDYPTLQWEK